MSNYYEAEFTRNGVKHSIEAENLTDFMQYLKDNNLLAEFEQRYFIDEEVGNGCIRSLDSYDAMLLCLEVAKKLNRVISSAGSIPYCEPMRTEEIIKLFTQIKFLLEKHVPSSNPEIYTDYIKGIERMIMAIQRQIITNKKEAGEPLSYEEMETAQRKLLSQEYPRVRMTKQYRETYNEPADDYTSGWDQLNYHGSRRQGEGY